MKNGTALVYSCSGCSSAAQMANELAVRMDRKGLAEMSCIAGVGGDVKPLVATAKSGRPVIVLDGCPLQCAKNCLMRHGVRPAFHFVLSEFGVRKLQHADYSFEEADQVFRRIAGFLQTVKSVPVAAAGGSRT